MLLAFAKGPRRDELLDRLARRDEPEGGRDRHARAVAMAIQAAVDLAGTIGRAHRLAREHAAQTDRALPRRAGLAQALAQRGEQRIVRGLGEVGHLDVLRELLDGTTGE